MSYCQKHRNHHCVHSHNCKDQHHKKKNQRTDSASSKGKHSSDANKKYNPPMGIIVDNEQCQFTYQGPIQGYNLNNEASLKKIESLISQLQQAKRKQMILDIENRQLRQNNSHVQCQIQYLRSQLDLLVNNHNADISKQIKRNVVEHTELNIQIKELTSALYDKQKKSQELSSQNYSLLRKNKQLQTTIKSYEDKIKIITLKNSELSFSFTQSNSKNKQLEKQLKLLNNRFATLASAADKSTKSAQNSSNQLTVIKQRLQKSLKTKQSESKKIKELHQIEKKTWQKIIQDLKQQNQKKTQQNKKLKQKAKKSDQNLASMLDDFQHAKKMILKYQKVNAELGKAKYAVKKDNDSDEESLIIQKKTVQKLSSKQSSQNLKSQFEQIQQKKIQLQQRVKQLETLLDQKTKSQNQRGFLRQISKNEPQTVIINQELILSIGASEEFKRLLEQKNATIKKLMREKAELYNKIYQQQAYG